MKLFLTFTLGLVSLLAQAQQDVAPADNQCRSQAKEVALKTYQNCVTETRTARIEQIRKEYQEKLAALKKEYDGQLQELKSSNKASPAEGTTPKIDKVEKQDLGATQPTVTLKPAKKIKAPSVVAEKRAKGEKGVKGIAKTLPVKHKPVETKPVSNMITESELNKSAPVTEEQLEKVQLSQAPSSEQNQVTGETENLNVVDPTLNSSDSTGSDLTSSTQD